MSKRKSASVALPLDIAEALRSKVASGEYASESAVIEDGLCALRTRDEMVELWLNDNVAKSFDESLARPNAAIPVENVMERLQAGRRARVDAAEG